MRPSASQSRRSKQRGAALVLFALLVFGLMALAALVIDLGMASATQGQMQSAVDGAALEGMRWRNTTRNGIPEHIEVIPFLPDNHRRELAREFVQMSFDDDLTPDNGDVDGFQVGPNHELNGGVGQANAFSLLGLGPTGTIDDPQLGLNTNQAFPFTGTYNTVEGDLVAGDYDALAQHTELQGYQRPDFTPVVAVANSPEASAFLVRMRRTGEVGLEGASWMGPTIPYLFGQGSLMGGGKEYSPRTQGIAVRATAIATGQPALQVGRRVASNPRIRGVVNFAFKRGPWREVPIAINSPECVRYDAGRLYLDYDLDGTEEEIGFFCEEVLTEVGQIVTPLADPSLLPPAQIQGEGWAPVYDDIFDGVETRPRVIGFVYVQLKTESTSGQCTGKHQLSRRPTTVASENASAIFPQNPVNLSRAGWDAIFDKRRDDPGAPPLYLLLAPAISR